MLGSSGTNVFALDNFQGINMLINVSSEASCYAIDTVGGPRDWVKRDAKQKSEVTSKTYSFPAVSGFVTHANKYATTQQTALK